MEGDRHPTAAYDQTAETSSESWGRRLQRGEAAAVREVRKRVDRILAHGGLAIPKPEREDLGQEVLTEIWQAVNRRRFDFAGGFWGFVEVVTSRRSIDYLRARREQSSIPGDVTSGEKGPLSRALDQERAHLASEVLSALDDSCRELITLRLRNDLSYREIANLTGKSEAALRVQLHRCLRRARKLLDSIGPPVQQETVEDACR